MKTLRFTGFRVSVFTSCTICYSNMSASDISFNMGRMYFDLLGLCVPGLWTSPQRPVRASTVNGSMHQIVKSFVNNYLWVRSRHLTFPPTDSPHGAAQPEGSLLHVWGSLGSSEMTQITKCYLPLCHLSWWERRRQEGEWERMTEEEEVDGRGYESGSRGGSEPFHTSIGTNG